MKTLAIDIETYSSTPITYGVHKYVESEDFRVLLFAYQVDDEPVRVIDLSDDYRLPEEVFCALTDTSVVKTAFNAMFERVCLDSFYNIKTGPWECTMIKAWSAGISGGLDAVSKALCIPQEAEKIADGKRLIKLFCNLQKPTKRRPSSAPYTKEELPEEWKRFKEYCGRDVEVESYIRNKLSHIGYEPELYALDQAINDRGIRLDLDMAGNALKIIADQTTKYTSLFEKVTGIDRPTRIIPLKAWLQQRTDVPITTLSKDVKDDLFELFKDDEDALLALECRYQTSKTSTTKYDMMLKATNDDERIRGCLQFYGTATGRWAGRLLQVQNLPQNHIRDLDTARHIVKHADFDFMEMVYKNPADVLSQCIRPCVIPAPGKKFVVADYSAIEARVIAYLAKENWVLDVFRTTGKIYEATAARMLHIPIETIKKGSPERQKGKVATLALGYEGGTVALIQMGALKMGIPENELQGIVNMWRESNPHIVRFWRQIENRVKRVVEEKPTNGNIYWKNGTLFIRLLSGRCLAYPRMRLQESKRGFGTSLAYGIVKSNGEWRWQETYGGRLTENIVQATARDCLADAMLRLDKAGYKIVMHIHDEVVIEVDQDDNEALDKVCAIMGEAIPWAPGLPLRADGYECSYYKKD